MLRFRIIPVVEYRVVAEDLADGEVESQGQYPDLGTAIRIRWERAEAYARLFGRETVEDPPTPKG